MPIPLPQAGLASLSNAWANAPQLLVERVTAAVALVARAVLAESATGTTAADRKRWARTVLVAPDTAARAVLWAIVAAPNYTADTVTDAAIVAAIEGMVDELAAGEAAHLSALNAMRETVRGIQSAR